MILPCFTCSPQPLAFPRGASMPGALRISEQNKGKILAPVVWRASRWRQVSFVFRSSPPYGTHSPPTGRRRAWICAPSKNGWGTAVSRRPIQSPTNYLGGENGVQEMDVSRWTPAYLGENPKSGLGYPARKRTGPKLLCHSASCGETVRKNNHLSTGDGSHERRALFGLDVGRRSELGA